jgi:predicted DsbA family dithiol-disulfide isomerase
MRNFLFANQKSIKIEDVPNHAMELGLDKHTFTQCLDTGKYASHLSNEIIEAKKAGVVAPTFFLLGFAEPDGKVKAARIIEGTLTYPVFKEAIDALLTTIK